MNKTITGQAPVVPPNYPDVLGHLSQSRADLEWLHAALAARPGEVNAGKAFEVVVLLQNMLGGEVDAVLRLQLPERDLAGKAGRFSTPLNKVIRIGLRPGEVGFAALPAIVGHQAAPGKYQIQVEITAESKAKAANRVRAVEGGAAFHPEHLTTERQALLKALKGLNFAAENVAKGRPVPHKAFIGAALTVLPATIVPPPGELRPNYTSLWTTEDILDPAAMEASRKAILDRVVRAFKREVIFFPLLKATQRHFDQRGYRLWAGECVMIAKLLTLILEMGAPVTVAGHDEPVFPRWHTHLVHLLASHPRLSNPDHLPDLIEQLYGEMLYDAALFGFDTLGTVTNESFGTEEEITDYAEGLVRAITGNTGPLDIMKAWLPLALGGLAINSRIAMPREDLLETVELFVRARGRRGAEMDAGSEILFQIADDLIERADHTFVG
jgi:hypothetical protein